MQLRREVHGFPAGTRTIVQVSSERHPRRRVLRRFRFAIGLVDATADDLEPVPEPLGPAVAPDTRGDGSGVSTRRSRRMDPGAPAAHPPPEKLRAVTHDSEGSLLGSGGRPGTRLQWLFNPDRRSTRRGVNPADAPAAYPVSRGTWLREASVANSHPRRSLHLARQAETRGLCRF
jgi:hypothetical protein